MSDAQRAGRWLRAGIVGRPHGLDGSFHVNLPQSGLLDLGASVMVAGRARRIERLAGHASRPILRLEGCSERACAERLRGQELLVAREAAPALGEDEWWASDLEGCAVCDGPRPVGTVARLVALPSCEALEVARDGHRPALLVPLVRDAVRTVDIDARVIDIDLGFLGEA
ncbi:MAG TPA: ribosome maturation factor RimM [Solirubrobacteraceae bacterium]|nr:ribosome maturation factor RimM [Solirubrobacteraceae bacterium]